MVEIWSSERKYTTWRQLWIALATAQQELGLPITTAHIESLRKGQPQLDLAAARAYEETLKHDVMAHIQAYGDVCPDARDIIHWGATSCFVTDNGDLIQMKCALELLRAKWIELIRRLRDFSARHAALPCLSYTHLQPASPTTVGKRAALWLQDVLLDFQALEQCIESLHFLGIKGATGTQASLLTLFGGDHNKVKQLDIRVAELLGFSRLFPLSGQTYTRKQDIFVGFTLSGMASSAHKFATDLRLLAHLRECEEPFVKEQVGSSAMPHKRNPVLAERVCGLARFLLSLQENPLYTHATQWLERSLDDSANRRLFLSNAFLTADALCNLLCHIVQGLTLYPERIAHNLHEELPFLGTELFLTEAVKRGKERSLVHERLRQHAWATRSAGGASLLDDLAADPSIGLSLTELTALTSPLTLTGRAEQQTLEFLRQHVDPLLSRYTSVKPPLPAPAV
jgi:adenylosuccinate lyase